MFRPPRLFLLLPMGSLALRGLTCLLLLSLVCSAACQPFRPPSTDLSIPRAISRCCSPTLRKFVRLLQRGLSPFLARQLILGRFKFKFRSQEAAGPKTSPAKSLRSFRLTPAAAEGAAEGGRGPHHN